MKISWFYYKENSILNNGFVRGLNYALLGILAIGPFLNQEFKGIFLSYYNLIARIIITPIITGFCVDIVEKNTTFYEWDYTERKKKKRFLSAYAGLCSTISACLILSLCIAYKALFKEGMPIGLRIIELLPPFYFAFNIVNIPVLFHSTFQDDLKQSYKIQKKPENWQDDGKEIRPEDEIEEIMKRDWGIR
jgi:hypothetical protein